MRNLNATAEKLWVNSAKGRGRSPGRAGRGEAMDEQQSGATPRPPHLSEAWEMTLMVIFSARYTLGLLGSDEPEYRQQGQSALSTQGLSTERAIALLREQGESAAIRYVLSKIPGIDLSDEEIEQSARLMEDGEIGKYISEQFGSWIIENTGIQFETVSLPEERHGKRE
jgi:hypothetical protein